MRDYDEWAGSLRLVRDEAFLPSEKDATERRLERDRRYDREHRAERTAYHREWRERNREHVREYNREWMRLHRPQVLHSKRVSYWNTRRHPVGSLHSLNCSGPTKATGCCCHKITMYDKP